MTAENDQVSQPSENETPAPEAAETNKPDMNTNFNLPNDHPAMKELAKVRREAGSARTEVNAFKEKAVQWDEYQASQKTDLERLTEENVSLKDKVTVLETETMRQTIANEFKLDAELAELLTGNDEQMRSKAKVLAEKFANTGNPSTTDLLAGNRGNPVTATSTKGGAFLMGLSAEGS